MRILSIDQGTSATKAILVESDGSVVATAEVPVHPVSEVPGAVEQDPAELLESVLSAGQQVMDAVRGPVHAVALANQGETVLAWDPSSGRPLTTAIGWQDSRSQSVCDELREHEPMLRQRTGLVLDPYFSAPKMAWLRRELTTDGVVTTTDSWLVHQLTGEFVTDAATASRSLLLDLDTTEWDAELVALFGLSGEQLPRVVSNDEVVGSTTAFGAATPVVGLVVDQQAALLAESCTTVGQAKCTYGTGAFLLANTGDRGVRSEHGLTSSVAWRTRDGTQFCIDGQVFTVASAVRWLNELGLVDDPRRLDQETSADSAGTLFVPALAGLAAPWWRPAARGVLSGLSLATTRGHIVRAVLEGVAATVAQLVRVVEAEGETSLQVLRVDGGLTHSHVLMQAQADLLQVSVEVYPSGHATPLGAAALARSALERCTPQEALWQWRPTNTFEPQWSRDRADDYLARWQRALEATEDGPS